MQPSFPHQVEETYFEYPLNPVSKPYKEGLLKVSEIHTLFYALYGNPKGIPVVILHGGPAAGCNDDMTSFFNLDRWHVVMFDQRGAGRSEPLACMEENTPQHSVSDIETLRKHLGIDQWVVYGGSWGSTLGLLYGQAYPDRCLGFILRGVFLGRIPDYLHLLNGMGKIFPEAYELFCQYIPGDERNDLLAAYYRRLVDPNPEVHMPAAKAFIRYDMTCATHLPNPELVEKTTNNNSLALSISRCFFHYSIHGFFLEPNQVLSHMQAIGHIPAIIVQGRWDAITPPEMAFLLYKQWPKSVLWLMTQGGHSDKNPAIGAALAKATDTFADKFDLLPYGAWKRPTKEGWLAALKRALGLK